MVVDASCTSRRKSRKSGLSLALLNARTCLRIQEHQPCLLFPVAFIPTYGSNNVPSSFLLPVSLIIPEAPNPLDVGPRVPLCACPAPPSNTNGPASFLGVIGPSVCNALPGVSAY